MRTTTIEALKTRLRQGCRALDLMVIMLQHLEALPEGLILESDVNSFRIRTAGPDPSHMLSVWLHDGEVIQKVTASSAVNTDQRPPLVLVYNPTPMSGRLESLKRWPHLEHKPTFQAFFVIAGETSFIGCFQTIIAWLLEEQAKLADE